MNKDKIKDILGTVVQIAVVAVIIIAIMMFVQNKLNADNSASGDEDVTAVGEGTGGSSADDSSDTTGYLIKVNKKKNAVIIYQKNGDGSKEAIKVMRCIVGSDAPTGTFEIMESYTWISADNVHWNKYSCRYSEQFWFQSADYFAPYNSYISVDSYNAIGSGDREKDSGCIKLTVADAKWIYDNCPSGTEVKIVKGKKSDELPLEFDEFTEIPSYAGWDPTDPDSDNPWSKSAKESIAVNSSAVYIERGTNVNYLSNVVAIDSDGSDITAKLDYEKIDSSETGTYEVKYSYTCKSGVTIKNTVTYEVCDSLGPAFNFVSTDEEDFTLEISEEDIENLNTEEFREKVIKKMKKLVEVIDVETKITGSRIVVTLPDGLKIGDNQIKYSAADDYDNVSYVIVSLNITLDSDEDEEDTTEKEEKTTEQETTIKETTTKNTVQNTTKSTTKTTTKSTTKSTTKATTKSTTKATTKATTTESHEESDSDDDEDDGQNSNAGEQSAGD